MGTIHRRIITPSGSPRWEGVREVRYDGHPEVRGTRQVLIGPPDGAKNFAVRYFEIEPGAKSSFDQHAHDHGVMVLRGRARLHLGDTDHEVAEGDAIYIAPNEPHQFETLGDEPFGFLCVVPPKDS